MYVNRFSNPSMKNTATEVVVVLLNSVCSDFDVFRRQNISKLDLTLFSVLHHKLPQ
jgi:hypothetical protein